MIIIQLSPTFHIIHSRKPVVGLLNRIVVAFFQSPALISVLIQIVDIAKQFALKHFFIFAPGKPAGIAAVDDDPGKIVSGACPLHLIRDTF